MAVVVTLLTCSWTSAVLAQDDLDARPRPSQEDRRRAVELYESSTHLLRSGDYERAAEQLEEAYRLFPQPALRVALARAYDGLGQTERAIEHYEAYLEEDPDAPDQGAIEGRLEELRLQHREEVGAPPPPPPPAPRGPDTTTPVIGFSLIGFGGAGLIAGGILAGIAASEHSASTAPASTQVEARAAYGRAQDLGTASVALLAAGGALAMAGIVIAVTAPSPEAPATPHTRVRAGLGSLSIEGSF